MMNIFFWSIPEKVKVLDKKNPNRAPNLEGSFRSQKKNLKLVIGSEKIEFPISNAKPQFMDDFYEFSFLTSSLSILLSVLLTYAK